MPKHNYARVKHFVHSTPWAILPDKFAEIAEFIGRKDAGIEVDGSAFAEAEPRQIAAYSGGGKNRSGVVAVLPIYGTIVQKADMFTKASGGTSTETLSKQFKKLMSDDEISAIVLEVDSPGGSVFGVSELANEIYEARGKKPIVAAVNSMAASAAFWIASAADEIVVTPSGVVGSVGVFVGHSDYSKAFEEEGIKVTLVHAGKYKVEGNPYEPLSEEAKARLQREVDFYYEAFTSDLAKFRGISVETVKEKFGQGRTLNALEMLDAGGIDSIATFPDTLSRVMHSSLSPVGGAATAQKNVDHRVLEMEIDCLESEI